jgi:uncharacterized protein (TIGR00369 family)
MDERRDLEFLREAFDETPFVSSFGLVADRVDTGGFVSRLAIDDRHQLYGTTFLHGGCVAAIGEHTARFAARTLVSPAGSVSTAEFRINYLAGASGNRLVCKSLVVAEGRHGLIVDSTLFSGTDVPDRLIAVTRSTVALDEAAPPRIPLAVTFQPAVATAGPRGDEGRFIKEDFGKGWHRFSGVEVEDADYGHIDLVQPVKPSHRGWDGVVHPGVIATLADSTGGACAYSTAPEGERLATLEYTLSYLEPCRAHVLRGRGRIIKAGKTVMLSRVDVLGDGGGHDEIVATALLSVMRVPGHERVLRARRTDAAPAASA